MGGQGRQHREAGDQPARDHERRRPCPRFERRSVCRPPERPVEARARGREKPSAIVRAPAKPCRNRQRLHRRAARADPAVGRATSRDCPYSAVYREPLRGRLPRRDRSPAVVVSSSSPRREPVTRSTVSRSPCRAFGAGFSRLTHPCGNSMADMRMPYLYSCSPTQFAELARCPIRAATPAARPRPPASPLPSNDHLRQGVNRSGVCGH